MNLGTVQTTLRRLVDSKTLIKERRGRWVDIEGTKGGVRELVCYQIAPIDLKIALDPNATLPTITERIIQTITMKGGDVSIHEFKTELSDVTANGIRNALRTLIRRGVVTKEVDFRHSGKKQANVFVYSFKR